MAAEPTKNPNDTPPTKGHPSHGGHLCPPSHLLLTGDWADYRRSQAAWAAHHAQLRNVLAQQRAARPVEAR